MLSEKWAMQLLLPCMQLATSGVRHACFVMAYTELQMAYLQMAKGNVGSLLVFDPEKIDFANDEQVKSAAGDAVVGIVTERGQH